MAITPQQANELNEGDRERVRELEKEIDKTILDRFPGSDNRVFYSARDMSPKVVKEIEKIYKAAGWRVSYQSDQRDGDYLEFRPDGGNDDGS